MEKFNYENVNELKELSSEIEFEIAINLVLTLRKKEKRDKSFKSIREKIKSLIFDYEYKYWIDVDTISDEKINQSDKAIEYLEQNPQIVKAIIETYK